MIADNDDDSENAHRTVKKMMMTLMMMWKMIKINIRRCDLKTKDGLDLLIL